MSRFPSGRESARITKAAGGDGGNLAAEMQFVLHRISAEDITRHPDYMEKWVEETDIDGLNLYCKLNPASAVVYRVRGALNPFVIADVDNPVTFQNVVDLLVPELQRRGVYWMVYPVPGGTLRENLTMSPGHLRLPDDHPAAVYGRETGSNLAKLA